MWDICPDTSRVRNPRPICPALPRHRLRPPKAVSKPGGTVVAVEWCPLAGSRSVTLVEHTTRWAVDERLQPSAVFRRRTVKRCSSAMNSGSVPL